MPQHPIEVDHLGRTLRGTAYTPARTGRHPTVLMLHGFTGQRIEAGFLFVRLGRLLAEQGIAAVTFDFLNSGESDGSFDQMLVTGEVADAMCMSQWLGGQAFVDRSRLALLGFSLGGLVACCTVARTNLYKALVLMAPTTGRNLSRIAGEAEGGSKLVVRAGHTLHPEFFNDLKTLDAVHDCTVHARPTLIVQGTGDTAVPPSVSDEYLRAMRRTNVPVTMQEIAGADHGFGSPEWRTQLFSSVSGFLCKHLCL